MRKLIPILCVILLTSCGGKDADHFETYADISDSAVHDYRTVSVVRSEGVEHDRTIDSSPDNVLSDAGYDAVWTVSRSAIIDKAYELYGVSEEWTIWLIGTTHNEGYQGDRYLEYAWACEILNCYRDWSVWDLDCIWGDYYSIGHAYDGYYAADDTTLEMIWYALTDRDTRIVEVDGMIRWDVPEYYLIYDSPYYNCQVWGE